MIRVGDGQEFGSARRVGKRFGFDFDFRMRMGDVGCRGV